MSQLASIQLAFDEALRGRRPSGAVPHVKGSDRAARVAIHQRNYRVSLTEALRVKFPATGWLVGEGFLDYGARLFVERHAPDSPCIAEYGFEFPDFLSALPGTLRLPYLADFMKLEWFFGKASIAVSRPAFDPSPLGSVPTDRLADSTAELQPGLFYLRTSWPVDRLLDLYLRESAPDSLEFEPAGRRLEISGARGRVRLECLPLPDFAFREALWKGQTLGRAAETALRFSEFDPERAMRSLATSGLMVGIRTFSPEETRL